jgi:hypothetical protein
MNGVRAAAIGLAVAALGAGLATGTAQAARDRYFTYEPQSDAARYRSAEITLVVRPGLLSSKVLRIYRARGKAFALDKPEGLFSGKQLHQALTGEDIEGLHLYAVDVKDGEGFAHGACTGADRAWIAFTPIRPYRDLRIYVLKYDAEAKAPALCETLDYRWRAEWLLPNRPNDARVEGEEGDPPAGPH